MTDLHDSEVALDPELIKKFNSIVKTILMIIGLALSLSLLNWTVTHKLAGITPIEASAITAEVRERQLGCLAKNIYYEAGAEPFEGKVAVAQVTLNRTVSGKFPGDICQTIYQKNIFYEKVVCQFSWACDRDTGVRPVNSAVFVQSMDVAKKVLLEGFRLPGLKDAMYFHADNVKPGWNREKIVQIGHHIFYR
jgi:spore germination cell wall hydrolase CwlJ-like protein